MRWWGSLEHVVAIRPSTLCTQIGWRESIIPEAVPAQAARAGWGQVCTQWDLLPEADLRVEGNFTVGEYKQLVMGSREESHMSHGPVPLSPSSLA